MTYDAQAAHHKKGDGAEGIAKALGGIPCGGGWSARCPAHDDRSPSLKISEAEDGRSLFYCYAGCSQDAVIDALKARGLWSGQAEGITVDPEAIRQREEAEKRRRKRGIAWARTLWKKSRPAEGTPVERYLASRGITGPVPPTLRYLPDAVHKATGLQLPCMVASVAVWPGREIAAIHRTYLTADGRKKAPVSPDKAMLGPCSGGAVRLAPVAPVMAVAEGIETALSVQLATGTPTWAALSAGGLEALILPDLPMAAEVTIFADNDENGRGQRAAEVAAWQWREEGRRVRITLPPAPGTDFNDLLRADDASALEIAS